MEKGKAFILVGHSNWGKSRTLHKLISPKIRGWWQFKKDILFFVKTMSNDDRPDSLLNFVKCITLATKKFVIIALCPHFKDSLSKTNEIILEIESKYSLFFFVLRNAYNGGSPITDEEISELSQHGIVNILEERLEDISRAMHFRKFIESHV